MDTFSCCTLVCCLEPRTAALRGGVLGGGTLHTLGWEVPLRGLYSADLSLQRPKQILRDPINMPTQFLAYAYAY